MKQRFVKTVGSFFAAALAVGGVAVMTAAPAHAASCHNDNFHPNPYDSRGHDGRSSYQGGSGCDNHLFSARFHAYDEVMDIYQPNVSWVKNVTVYVRVYSADGSTVVDRDTLRHRYSNRLWDYHQLGTPDGTGDIAEGRRVRFQVCAAVRSGDNWPTRCGAWAEATS